METVGTACRPVKYPYPLPHSQDFVMCAECGFALSCEYACTSPGKDVFLKATYCAPNLYVLFSIMVPSQKCKLPLPRALTQPHTMTDPGFGLVAGNSLDDPFLFGRSTRVHSSQNTWNTDSSDPEHVSGAEREEFPLPLTWVLAPPAHRSKSQQTAPLISSPLTLQFHPAPVKSLHARSHLKFLCMPNTCRFQPKPWDTLSVWRTWSGFVA